jgi:hypothetical protein
MTPATRGHAVTAPLPVLTASEAYEQGLFPPAAFKAFRIAPGTVRAWASLGLIQARAVGPRGARLYSVAEISAYSISTSHRPRVRRVSSVA